MLYSLAFLALAQASCAKTFDYIIVGGGTAGLLTANRLSANPNTSVAVIEAGDSAYSNANVTQIPRTIADFSPGIGTQIDWKYTTVPQEHAGNRSLAYLAGKALGGSTTINGMTYLRAEKEQIDAWEQLGNEGWNWDALWPYYLSQEAFQKPGEEQVMNGARYEEAFHGVEGGLKVGFTPYLAGMGSFDVLGKTSEALGVPVRADSNGGRLRGTNVWPMMMDVKMEVRADAARAWYFPVKERENLHVLLNTTVRRIVWDDDDAVSSTTGVVATGVEILTSDSAAQGEIIYAAKEIILASGSIKSPSILEHSGVGNPSILSPLGIKTVISNPNVGSNLQDQPANGITYSSTKNWTGYASFTTHLTATDLFGPDLESIAAEVKNNITAYAAAIIASYPANTTTLDVQTHLLTHHFSQIFTPNSTIPIAEILWVPYQTVIVAQYWSLLPFSRGSIHINSADASIPPAINPAFLALPIDILVESAIAVSIRRFFATPPLSTYVTTEVTPGKAVVPASAGYRDNAWHDWIRATAQGNSHPLGTCGMMSRDLGGVVDKTGKVYGTRNVRVVDASVWAGQISGHLTAGIFAVAGKIVDGILWGM